MTCFSMYYQASNQAPVSGRTTRYGRNTKTWCPQTIEWWSTSGADAVGVVAWFSPCFVREGDIENQRRNADFCFSKVVCCAYAVLCCVDRCWFGVVVVVLRFFSPSVSFEAPGI